MSTPTFPASMAASSADVATTGAAPSRRTFLRGAALLAACAFVPGRALQAASAPAFVPSGKPNSVFGGVRIGCITYSYRPDILTAEDTLSAILQDGLSEVEMMGGPIQAYAGMPPIGVRAAKGKGKGKGKADDAAPAPAPARPTDAQREAELAKCRAMRKMYNDAGVNIHLHKLPFGPSDEEIDFNFQVALALGCKGITTERSDTLAAKLAPFADKHKIWVGFHNHTTNFPSVEKPDPLFNLSPYIGFNLDIGHYVAGTKGQSPIPVIEKYHDRIVSLHLKDRTADGGNLPWGKGQTPIKDVLRLMKKEKWTFPADIELEYKIPEGSTSVAEVGKCVQYCREALA